MQATRRTHLALVVALLLATLASGWLVSLALALRRQEAGLDDLVLGALSAPLLVIALLVLTRILYRTGYGDKKGG